MVFSSSVFLILFLPIVMIFYYFPVITGGGFMNTDRYHNAVLLVASIFFYAWGEPIFVMIMLFLIILNHYGSKAISKEIKGQYRKALFRILLIIDIGVLFVFKYLDFLIENINVLTNAGLPELKLSLPIGISFFTFQILSYIIDVYYRRVKVSESVFNTALYISMFPQLVAGPIVRYPDIYKEITGRQETYTDFTKGIRRFVIGLGKKVLLADMLALIADEMFTAVSLGSELSVLSAWLGAATYTLQIYYDFSGYSDMAIGLGMCFGFHFYENFNSPYISRSITEFWKRWHISLTNWFRSYVYIPLGGNRCSKKRNIFNLFIVWLLTGIWHGANWTFIIWGLVYFVLIVVEKFIFNIEGKGFLGRIYTLFIVNLLWVMFRSDSLNDAIAYIRRMFGYNTSVIDNTGIIVLRGSILLLLLSVIGCLPWKKYADMVRKKWGGVRQCMFYAVMSIL